MPTNTVLQKHVDEKKVLAADFKHDQAIIDGAALLDNANKVFASTGGAGELTIESITVSGTQVQATVSGGAVPSGETSKTYWLDVGADTDDGQHLEDCVQLRVYQC